MTFLCLGVIEHQHEFFQRELKRVFGEKIDHIGSWKPPWAEATVYVCMADSGIHSEIKMFVTGFTSGFRSAL